MSFSEVFLNGYSVDVVIGTEGNDFFIGGDVVDDASADAVDIKVVRVHECHAT